MASTYVVDRSRPTDASPQGSGTPEVPECRIVATGDADVNAHMKAVKEQMGSRLVEQLLELQKIVVGG